MVVTYIFTEMGRMFLVFTGFQKKAFYGPFLFTTSSDSNYVFMVVPLLSPLTGYVNRGSESLHQFW